MKTRKLNTAMGSGITDDLRRLLISRVPLTSSGDTMAPYRKVLWPVHEVMISSEIGSSL